jgi:hypothetical protein
MIGLEAPDTVSLDLVGATLEEEIQMFVPTAHLADVKRVHLQSITARNETDR